MNDNFIGENIQRLRKTLGISQEFLGVSIGVTKSTISHWELGRVFPRRHNIIKLATVLNVSTEEIENDNQLNGQSTICSDVIKKIPFYSNIRASAGHGIVNEGEKNELIHIKDLPSQSSYKDLCCILASGDSMEPALYHGSVIVIDTSKTTIIDGKMYVFGQNDSLRVKVFSYERNGVKVSSYNKEYEDEFYRLDELSTLRVIGRVVFYSTKID